MNKEVQLYDDMNYVFKDYKIKEEKLIPDFLYTSKLLDLAQKDKLKISIDSLKTDLLQIILVDNGLLKTKMYNNIERQDVNFEIEGKLYECSELFKDVLKEKELYPDKYISLHYPEKLEVYKNKLPKSIKNKQIDIDKLFKNHSKAYFVFDAKQNTDPILVVQLNDNPERTFIIGVWD